MSNAVQDWLNDLVQRRSSRRSVVKGVGGSLFAAGAVSLPDLPHIVVPAAASVSHGTVRMSSPFRGAWLATGGAEGRLGLPLTDEFNIAGGEAVYFERGCIWRGPESGGALIESHLDPPLLGRPAMLSTTDARIPGLASIMFEGVATDPRSKILGAEPARRVLGSLWRDRLALRPVLSPGQHRELVPLSIAETLPGSTVASPALENPSRRLDVTLAPDARLENRTLYDIVLTAPNGDVLDVSPHALYAQDSWDRFGIIHATDLHVARRDDVFEKFFTSAVSPGETNHNFVNYNNGFRDLIRYANRLHTIGLVDLIIVTGDLIDYIYERDDPHLGMAGDEPQGGNFAYFRQIMLGQKPRPGPAATGRAPYGELRVPIYTTLGNHDYRRGRYELAANVTVDTAIPGFGSSKSMPQFADHNLLECEALSLQPGRRWVDVDTDSQRAHDMLDVNPRKERYDPNRIPAFNYYRTHIGKDADGSYVIGGPDGVAELGNHRIVMLNTLWDAGIPDDDDWDLIRCKVFGCGEDMDKLLDGSPNQSGFDATAFELFKRELGRAPKDGVFIVGMHGPIINPAGSEFPHYLRETEHVQADARETLRFIIRNGGGALLSIPNCEANPVSCLTSGYEGWGRSLGKPYFKYGDITTFLDASVARCQGKAEAFLKACAGDGVPRPVDAVLFGHVHRRVEFRVDRNEQGQLRYYTDFYTENPTSYYNSKKYSVTAPVQITVKAGADPKKAPTVVRDHRPGAPVTEFRTLAIPPYANPLNKSTDLAGWWTKHRPLLLQTASLGPIDINQRFSREGCGVPRTTMDRSFQGFRLISIANNRIAKIHYITLDELYRNDFWLPLEAELLALGTGGLAISARQVASAGTTRPICIPGRPCNPAPALTDEIVRGRCWMLTHESGSVYEVCDEAKTGTATAKGLQPGRYTVSLVFQGLTIASGTSQSVDVRPGVTTSMTMRPTRWPAEGGFPACIGSATDSANCGKCKRTCWDLNAAKRATCQGGICTCQSNAAVQCRETSTSTLPMNLAVTTICCNLPEEECLSAVAKAKVNGVPLVPTGRTCRLLKKS